MSRFAATFTPVLLCWLFCAASTNAIAAPLTYAWQGGETGILQNSLPAFMLAANRADAVHLPVVATKDDQILVLATPDLARFTDVAAVFPERLRPDGSAASVDFTLAEIRRLRRLADKNGQSGEASLPAGLSSLDEILAIGKVMTSRFGQQPALIVELVEPAWHRQSGKDLSALVLRCLDRQKIAADNKHIILMSEDGAEMQRLARELLPPTGRQLSLIQMIGPEPSPQDEDSGEPPVPDINEWAFTQLGLRVIAGYATGVAIDKSRLVTPQGTPSQGEYLARAKKLGLQVFVYPVGPDDTIPRIIAPAEPPVEPPVEPPAKPSAEAQPAPVAASADAAPAEAKISTMKASDFFLKIIGADGLFFSPLPPVTPTTVPPTVNETEGTAAKAEAAGQ